MQLYLLILLQGSLMSRELQMTDSVTTEEFAECTSTEHQPPLQVQSSHAPVSDQSLLHPFVRQPIITQCYI